VSHQAVQLDTASGGMGGVSAGGGSGQSLLSTAAAANQQQSSHNHHQYDPIHILSLYTESSHRIEHIVPFLPDEYSAILGKFAKVYLERANRLRDEIRRDMMHHGGSQESVVWADTLDKSVTTTTTGVDQTAAAQTLDAPSSSSSPSSSSDTVPHDESSPKSHSRSRSKSLGITLGNISKKVMGGAKESGDSAGNASSGMRRTVAVTPPTRFLTEDPVRVQFHEIDIPRFEKSSDESASVPQSWVRRPFWLMRLLARSMREGAHVSQNLYVSRDVWYQKDANQKYLAHLGPKVQFCERLYILLKELHMYEEHLLAKENQLQNLAHLDEKITEFMKQAEREHEVLSKAIQSSKSKKMFGIGKIYSKVFSGSSSKKASGDASGVSGDSGSAAGAGSGADDAQTPYVPVLIKLFDQCQFVDKWYSYVDELSKTNTDEPTLERTTKIKNVRHSIESMSMLLYLRLCSFVLQDMHTLLECYLRQMRDSFEDLTI